MPGARSVEVTTVSKVFPGASEPARALDAVTLSVGDGEFVSIVGPSGCGKSTLLRLVAGLTLPTDGEVRIAGRPVDRPVPSVALMFQRPALLPWRTVRANIVLPGEVLRLDPVAVGGYVDELLDMVGLREHEHRYPFELSVGMQQRVSLCRALVSRPSVLLMDEPFAALDEITRERMTLELLRILESTGTTVLFVTHSISEAVFVADRVLVMTDRPGRIHRSCHVPFARPRRLALLASNDFALLCGTIRETINVEPR